MLGVNKARPPSGQPRVEVAAEQEQERGPGVRITPSPSTCTSAFGANSGLSGPGIGPQVPWVTRH